MTFFNLPEQLSPLQYLSRSLGQGIGSGLQAKQIQQSKLAQMLQEQQLGLEKLTLADKLKSAQAQKQEQQSFEADKKNYDVIKDAFGDKFADVWMASPTGARTELLKAGVDANLRGIDLKKIFGETDQTVAAENQPIVSEKEFEFPKLVPPEGLTPKEIVGYEKDLRKENAPQYQESTTKVRSLEKESDSFRILNKLNESEKLPSGLGRVFLDEGGNIRPWAQILSLVPPEAERFAKTINDFTTKAKDSYGSRVTNFDLQQFMKRLPTLMNSEEGRRQILQQMQTINELDKLYYSALQQVYRHYGLGKIPQEKAEEIASSMIFNEENDLRRKFDEIETQSADLSSKSNIKRKSLEDIFG